MSQPDIESILEGLSSPRAEGSWREFLERYTDLIHQIAGLYEGDRDHQEDCFLFVCEALHEDGFRRLRRFRPDGPASFETWLRAVARNLAIDWRRQAFGRFRVLKAVDGRSALEQDVFRCAYQLGLTATEILGTLAPEYPALTRDEVDQILADFHTGLTPRERWIVSRRRPAVEPLDLPTAEGTRERPVPDAGRSPEQSAVDSDERERLAGALSRLAPEKRLALRLRFEQELSLGEVARMMRLSGGPQGASREIERALADLRREMESRSWRVTASGSRTTRSVKETGRAGMTENDE